MVKTILVILLPMFVGLILWNDLPDMIPTNFGFDGQVNRTSSKLFAVVGFPLMIAAIHFFCVFATMKDPKHSAISSKIMNMILWICPVCSIYCGGMMYGYVYGFKLNSGTAGSVFIGLLLIIIGNYLPKCKHNYTVGIKLPWTLASEENWIATHRFAGWVWTFSGFVIIFFGITKLWVLMISTLFASVLITTIYSYMYYEKYESKEKQ